MIQVLTTQALDDGVLKIAPPILSRVYSTAWAAICTFITVFTFHSLNFIAIELEMPFGDDENDLPLDHFQAEMNRSILLLLHEMSDHLPHTSSKCRREYESLIGCSRDTVRRTQNLHRSNTEGELNNHHDALFEGDEGLDDLMSTTSSMPPELDDERKEEGLSSVKVLAEKTIHTVEHAAESAVGSVASMAKGLLHEVEGVEQKVEGFLHRKNEAEKRQAAMGSPQKIQIPKLNLPLPVQPSEPKLTGMEPMLDKSMDHMTSKFENWIQKADDQAKALSRNTEVILLFTETLPKLLMAMEQCGGRAPQAASARSSPWLLAAKEQCGVRGLRASFQEEVCNESSPLPFPRTSRGTGCHSHSRNRNGVSSYASHSESERDSVGFLYPTR